MFHTGITYSYDDLLIRINENFGEREMDNFVFAFRNDLPRTILEVRKPLLWFKELESRYLLHPDDLNRLANFLKMISHMSLLKDVRCYQAKRRIVVFFQRNVEEKIPGLRLDKKYNQPCKFDRRLPRNFLKKCQELFRGTDHATRSAPDLRILLSRGARLLVNSCRPCSHDLDAVAMKILYLSNMFVERFQVMMIEHTDMMSQLFPVSPPCLVRDNCRERLPNVTRERRPARESEWSLLQRRPSNGFCECFVCSVHTTCLVYFTNLINWWKGKANNVVGRRPK